MLHSKKICRIFTTKKHKVFCVLTAIVISTYLLVLIFLVNNQLSIQKNLMNPYFFSSEEKRHIEQMYTDKLNKCELPKNHQNKSEQHNFVFIKGMKSATSTLLGVFYRFGYTRNLTFVSPLNQKLYLNWPFPLTHKDFRPSSRGYNVLTDHSIYTEDVMKSIMPSDTVYISIIREPFSQLKSIFQYFKVHVIAEIPDNVSNPVIEYISHLKKYEAVYTSTGNTHRWCIPDGFSMTKNLMSHCLGMPLGFPPGSKDISNHPSAVDKYIQYLDSKFSLIMITEHFYESLILLRRYMSWAFKDIVFMNSNVAKYSFKDTQVSNDILDLHRNWSSADYKLYHYFNNTLWKRISCQGSEFNLEVDTFKLVEAQVQQYCNTIYTKFKRNEHAGNMSETVVEETTWNNRFTITSEDCWMLGPNPYEMIKIVQIENDKREVILLEEQKKQVDNRTMKSTC